MAMSKDLIVFPCIISAETSYILDIKISEFSIVSEYLCNKLGEKGENYSREERNKGR